MEIDRRRLLLGASGASLLLGGAAAAQAPARLPSPDLRVDPATFAYATGVRPVRRGGFRLETEQVSGPGGATKAVVHNYGHGGGGISLSWGCASLTADEVARVARPGSRVAVLGAGIMGLTAAATLASRYRVTVYAREVASGDARRPATTSDVAGGQWAPSFNGASYRSPISNAAQGNDFSRRMLAASTRAYARFVADMRAGDGYIVPVRNYTADPEVSRSGEWAIIRDATAGSTLPCTVSDNIPLPFADFGFPDAPARMGGVYDTLLVNGPAMIGALKRSLAQAGVRFVQRSFNEPGDLFSGPTADDGVVVNCTGIGSRRLFGDSAVYGAKGLLALLPPDPAVLRLRPRYLFSGFGYVFPRSDVTIVGGTAFELADAQSDAVSAGRWRLGDFPEDAASDVARARVMVRLMAAQFAGIFPLGCEDFDWFVNDDRALQACD